MPDRVLCDSDTIFVCIILFLFFLIQNVDADDMPGSAVGIDTRLRAGRRRSYGLFAGRGWSFTSSLSRPDRLWDPPNLLLSEYQWLFPLWYTAGS